MLSFAISVLTIRICRLQSLRFIDLVAKLSGLIRDSSLILRESLSSLARFRAPLHRFLLANDSVELLDVAANARLLILQPIRAIFRQQQIEQGLQVRFDGPLTLDCLLQLLALKELYQLIQLRTNLTFFAA